MTTDEFLAKLTTPPKVQPGEGKVVKSIRRVAKVRMAWDEAAQQWDFDKPEGISTYAESTHDPKAKNKARPKR